MYPTNECILLGAHTVGENSIGRPKILNNFGALSNYCFSAIAPQIVITLTTFAITKVVALKIFA